MPTAGVAVARRNRPPIKPLAVVKKGFTALKFDPFPGPWRAYISRQDEDAAVAKVKAVREAVGPDVEILVEVHRRLAPMHADPRRPRWSRMRPSGTKSQSRAAI